MRRKHIELGVGCHQLGGDVTGMRRGVTKSPEVRDLLCNPSKQPRKLGRGRGHLRPSPARLGSRLMPRIDRLTKEGDLPHAPRHEIADLPDDLLGWPVPLGSACIRNDTKRAAFVAALHHGDVRRDLPVICMGLGPQKLRVVHVEHRPCDRWGALLYLPDQGRELRDVVRPEDDVHKGGFSEQTLALLLGNAPRNRQHSASLGLFERPKRPQKAHQLVLRLLAYAAGVDDQQIGQRRLARLAVTACPQDLLDPPGVVDVHLATKGLDEVLLHRGCGASFSSLQGDGQTAEITPFAGGIGALRATSPR